jgi:hypothetical protein
VTWLLLGAGVAGWVAGLVLFLGIVVVGAVSVADTVR